MTTFIGIITGTSLLFYAIVSKGGVEIFWSSASLMIVGGGTFAALLVSYPLPRIIRVTGVLMQIFKKDVRTPSWVIKLMVTLSFKARQKSLLSLEEEVRSMDSRLAKLGLEMVIDGHPAGLILGLDQTLDVQRVDAFPLRCVELGSSDAIGKERQRVVKRAGQARQRERR